MLIQHILAISLLIIHGVVADTVHYGLGTTKQLYFDFGITDNANNIFTVNTGNLIKKTSYSELYPTAFNKTAQVVSPFVLKYGSIGFSLSIDDKASHSTRFGLYDGGLEYGFHKEGGSGNKLKVIYGSNIYDVTSSTNIATGFHHYNIEWTDHSIIYAIDNIPVKTIVFDSDNKAPSSVYSASIEYTITDSKTYYPILIQDIAVYDRVYASYYKGTSAISSSAAVKTASATYSNTYKFEGYTKSPAAAGSGTFTLGSLLISTSSSSSNSSKHAYTISKPTKLTHSNTTASSTSSKSVGTTVIRNITTGVVVVTSTKDDVVTSYTTYCPLTANTTSNTTSNSKTTFKAATPSTSKKHVKTTVIGNVTTGVIVVTSTKDDVVTSYTTYCPLTASESHVSTVLSVDSSKTTLYSTVSKAVATVYASSSFSPSSSSSSSSTTLNANASTSSASIASSYASSSVASTSPAFTLNAAASTSSSSSAPTPSSATATNHFSSQPSSLATIATTPAVTAAFSESTLDAVGSTSSTSFSSAYSVYSETYSDNSSVVYTGGSGNKQSPLRLPMILFCGLFATMLII